MYDAQTDRRQPQPVHTERSRCRPCVYTHTRDRGTSGLCVPPATLHHNTGNIAYYSNTTAEIHELKGKPCMPGAVLGWQPSPFLPVRAIAAVPPVPPVPGFAVLTPPTHAGANHVGLHQDTCPTDPSMAHMMLVLPGCVCWAWRRPCCVLRSALLKRHNRPERCHDGVCDWHQA